MVHFKVLKLIREALESVQSVTSVIDNAATRLELYYGRIHLVVAQENRIADYFWELRGRLARTFTIIIMDYKMKFETIRYREKSVEFYGQRGISWHDSVVILRREHDDATVSDDLGTILLDHIAENYNAQDSWAVL